MTPNTIIPDKMKKVTSILNNNPWLAIPAAIVLMFALWRYSGHVIETEGDYKVRIVPPGQEHTSSSADKHTALEHGDVPAEGR